MAFVHPENNVSFLDFVVLYNRVPLGNTKIFEKYGISNSLQWNIDGKKVNKMFIMECC